MRLIKRLAGWMGFGNHEVNKDPEDDTDVDGHDNQNSVEDINHYIDGSLPRKGFSVPVRVHVDKARQIAPILVPCPAADGAVQGLQWYTRSLKIDEDGDVADEFLEEVFPETGSYEPHQNVGSKFQVNLSTKPAEARNPLLSQDGNVKHYVKHQGRLQLL